MIQVKESRAKNALFHLTGKTPHPGRQPFTRHDFTRIINFLGYRMGAEVGVHHGYFSYYLLRHSWLGTLYSVDAYRGKWSEFRKDAQSMLSEFGARSKILSAASSRAAAQFAKEGRTFDFVYIDADHHYESVAQDLRLWWPLVAQGGLLAGHDYTEAKGCGVIQAVDEFVAEHGLTLYLTREAWASWFVWKE